MRSDVISFLKKICAKYNLRAVYISDVRGQNDIWSITTPQGMGIMNFTTEIFYHLPQRERERMIEPTLKRGLSQLLGERSLQKKGQLLNHKRMGKIIV